MSFYLFFISYRKQSQIPDYHPPKTMKKTIICIAMAASIMACGNKASNTEPTQNDSTTVVADTTAVTTDDTTDESTFKSPDYALLCLFDKVKSIQENIYLDDDKEPYHQFTYTFDANGQITKGIIFENYLGEDKVKLERNADGTIKTVLWYISDFDSWFSTNIKYNDNGQAVAIDRETVDGGKLFKVTYDKDGNIATMEETWEGEGEVENYLNTYTIKQKDNHGNWTEMTYSHKDIKENTVENFKLIRTINYYE